MKILHRTNTPTIAIAARPHGGGGDAELGANDLALIDGGGMLHNYWSDLTRVRNYFTHYYLP